MMKQCPKCGRLRTVREARARLGDYRCRDCTLAYKRQYNERNKDRDRDKKREWVRHKLATDTEFVQRKRISNRKYNAKRVGDPVYKQQERARDKLQWAVRQGNIQKPDRCDSCSSVAELHGHHHDYDKPYEVEWLCPLCHGTEHRVVRGEPLPTFDDVRGILADSAGEEGR